MPSSERRWIAPATLGSSGVLDRLDENWVFVETGAQRRRREASYRGAVLIYTKQLQ